MTGFYSDAHLTLKKLTNQNRVPFLTVDNWLNTSNVNNRTQLTFTRTAYEIIGFSL